MHLFVIAVQKILLEWCDIKSSTFSHHILAIFCLRRGLTSGGNEKFEELFCLHWGREGWNHVHQFKPFRVVMKQQSTCNNKYPVYSLDWQAKLPSHWSTCQTAQTQRNFLRDTSQHHSQVSANWSLVHVVQHSSERAVSLLSELNEEMSCD